MSELDKRLAVMDIYVAAIKRGDQERQEFVWEEGGSVDDLGRPMSNYHEKPTSYARGVIQRRAAGCGLRSEQTENGFVIHR